MDIVEFLVDYGSDEIIGEVAGIEFLKFLLNLTRQSQEREIQFKILSLLKKWGENFKDNQRITSFSELYNKLLAQNVTFPDDYESVYPKYIKASGNKGKNKEDIHNDFYSDFGMSNISSQSGYSGGDDEGDFDYTASIHNLLKSGKFADKYSKIIAFLQTLAENIALGNDIIDNEKPRCNNDILREIIKTLIDANNRLIKLMGAENFQMKDEKLTEIAFLLYEDSNRTQKRNEYLTSGQKPEPFLSVFVEKNATGEFNMKMLRKPKAKGSGGNRSMKSSGRSNNPPPRPQRTDAMGAHNANELMDIFSNMQSIADKNPSAKFDEPHPLDLFDFSDVSVNKSPLEFGGNQPNNQMPNMMPQKPKPNMMVHPQMQGSMNNPQMGNQMGNPQPKPDATQDLQNKLNQIYNQQNQMGMQQPNQNYGFNQMGNINDMNMNGNFGNGMNNMGGNMNNMNPNNYPSMSTVMNNNPNNQPSMSANMNMGNLGMGGNFSNINPAYMDSGNMSQSAMNFNMGQPQPQQQAPQGQNIFGNKSNANFSMGFGYNQAQMNTNSQMQQAGQSEPQVNQDALNELDNLF
ncbi:MAG: hypothetical protein MJ252_02500 [archaeon]|nr:hypothetical protein [archaeon]